MSNSGIVSIIIVNYKTPDQTIACLRSIIAHNKVSHEIVVVENYSNDGSAERIKAAVANVKLIESPTNNGFAAGCRLGVEATNGDYLAFINSDCIDENGAINKLALYLDGNPEVSAVVPRLLESDGQVQNNVARLPTIASVIDEYILGKVSSWYGDLSKWTKAASVESFSGAALMIRRKDYLAAGGFDTRYFMYVEDVELSWNLNRLNKVVVYLPSAVMTHSSGGSSKSYRLQLNKMLHSNRIDYIRRHFPWPQSWLAALTITIGIHLLGLKNVIKQTTNSSHPS